MSNLGLAGIRKAKALAAERRQFSDVKVEWFKLNAAKPSSVVQFLHELDEDGKLYDPNRGLPVTEVEHNGPGKEGWKSRASCSMEDEGRCYACEQHSADPTAGWKARTNLYMNILDEDGKVKILSRNVNNAFVDTLIEYYEGDEDNRSIMDRAYKLKLTGEGFNTTWTMIPVNKQVDASNVELFDIESAVLRKIPYDKQREWYGKNIGPAPKETSTDSSSSEELDWA